MRIRDKNSEQAVVTKTAPLNVRTVAALQSPIRNWVASEGTVRAVRFKHLAFDVDGEVTYIADRDGRNLREGDRVTKGELLAQIDDRQLQADVNKAKASITEAREQKGSHGSRSSPGTVSSSSSPRPGRTDGGATQSG